MAVRCRSMWHSIAGECPLHTYQQCKGQNVAWRLAGDCLHFLVERFGGSHQWGRGHYSSHHRPVTSNGGLRTLTFSRPSKIKSITLWPGTGKHCVGINHLLFHAWLCSLLLDVWLCVCFGGNGWLAVWETDWLLSLLNDWPRFWLSWGRQSSVRAGWRSGVRG